MDNKPEELNQNAFDNGGDEELREDRGDFFEADDIETLPEGKKYDDVGDGTAKPDRDKAGDADPEYAKADKRAVPLDRLS